MIRYHWSRRPAWPYDKSCDELCNTIRCFYVPVLGAVDFVKIKNRYSDGLWETSGSMRYKGGGHINVSTYAGHQLALAEIPATAYEIDELWSSDHPKIWRDIEVFERAVKYEIDDPDTDDFIEISPVAFWKLRSETRT